MTTFDASTGGALPNMAALRIAMLPVGARSVVAATGGVPPVTESIAVETGAVGDEAIPVEVIPAAATGTAEPAADISTGAMRAAVTRLEGLSFAPLKLKAADLVSADILNLALQLRKGTDFTRAEAQVPISPTDPPSDATLFDDHADPAHKLYLPRYVLATRALNQYAVAVEERGTAGWALTVALRAVAPPGLATEGVGVLPHTPSLVLTYEHPGGGQRVLAFEPPVEVQSEQGSELQAELRLPDLPSRDAIVHALSDTTAGARLVVRRAFEVAVPVPPGETPPWDPGNKFEALAAAGRLPVLDRLQDIRAFPIAAFPIHVGVTGHVEAQAEPVPAEPRFRRSPAVLDSQVGDLFAFDRATHPYIFQAVIGAAPGSGRLVEHRVSFRGRSHRYFQDPHHRNLFYYTPDEYRIPRAAKGARTPLLRIRVVPAPALPERIAILTDYVAVGTVDRARLANAATHLASKVPEGFGALEFERFNVKPERLRYRLRLPRADGASQETVIDGGQATLALESIMHSFTLPVEQFRAIFDAIHGDVGTLFQGTIELTLDGDAQPELIDVHTRAQDFSGELFELAAPAKVVSADGTDVKLANVVESPIRLSGLKAAVVANGSRRPLEITGVDAGAAVELKPGERLALHVAPPAGDPTATGRVRVTARAELVPDGAALWSAILDASSGASYRRELTVDADPLYQDQERSRDVAAYVVEFDTGDSVALTPDERAATIGLKLPVKDFVLSDPGASANGNRYRYRCRPVHVPPRDEPEAKWRTDTFPLLFPIAD